MLEEWLDIVGYEGKYQISNKGKVKSLYYKKSSTLNPKILIPRRCVRRGKPLYYSVVLSKNNKTSTKYIHRLVAEHFVPNPSKKPYVNHLDGDKSNNTATNLEWVTPLENNLHCYRVLGKHPKKSFIFDKSKNSIKVKQYYISEDGYKYHLATYANSRVASMITNICKGSIQACCRGHKEHRQAGGYIWEYETNSN